MSTPDTSDKDRTTRAYEAGAQVTRERMRREAPLAAEALQAVEASDIVVVKGSYDHVEMVLDALKLPYQAIEPEAVGNDRRLLISDYAGKSSVVEKAKQYDVDLTRQSPEVGEILDRVMKLENEGYSFEGAEASFELLLKKAVGKYKKLFDLKGFRVIIEKRGPGEEPITEVTLKIAVDGKEAFTVAEGDGPVHAIDNALRLALRKFYAKELAEIKLTDYKVRVVNTRAGTAAKVRTTIEFRDANEVWSTVGVSENIIEASWQALADSVEYGLLKQMGSK